LIRVQLCCERVYIIELIKIKQKTLKMGLNKTTCLTLWPTPLSKNVANLDPRSIKIRNFAILFQFLHRILQKSRPIFAQISKVASVFAKKISC
jgi:hypothetical protein